MLTSPFFTRNGKNQTGHIFFFILLKDDTEQTSSPDVPTNALSDIIN